MSDYETDYSLQDTYDNIEFTESSSSDYLSESSEEDNESIESMESDTEYDSETEEMIENPVLEKTDQNTVAKGNRVLGVEKKTTKTTGKRKKDDKSRQEIQTVIS